MAPKSDGIKNRGTLAEKKEGIGVVSKILIPVLPGDGGHEQLISNSGTFKTGFCQKR